jgi:hypothetical protein
MFDYHRTEMPIFFVIAILLCAVAPICLFWQPMTRLGLLYFFGPYIAVLLWLATIVMAVRVHRWRGLWLLTTAIVIAPVTYLHFALVALCALNAKNCL